MLCASRMEVSTPRCDFLNEPNRRSMDWGCFPGVVRHFQTACRGWQGCEPQVGENFPSHVLFYIEREETIEVVRILCGGQDMGAEVERD